jgi:hypothetical protein
MASSTTVIPNPKDDKSWGKGRWQSIHLTAAFADNPEKRKYFNEWIRHQLANLPCGECIKHATAYLAKNPPEQSPDPFLWAWEFHNYVNKWLKKPEMDYTTATDIYMNGKIKVCDSGCDEGGKSSKSGGENKSDKVKSSFSHKSKQT